MVLDPEMPDYDDETKLLIEGTIDSLIYVFVYMLQSLFKLGFIFANIAFPSFFTFPYLVFVFYSQTKNSDTSYREHFLLKKMV